MNPSGLTPMQELENEVKANGETIKNLQQQKETALAKIRALEDTIDKLANGEVVETPSIMKSDVSQDDVTINTDKAEVEAIKKKDQESQMMIAKLQKEIEINKANNKQASACCSLF